VFGEDRGKNAFLNLCPFLVILLFTFCVIISKLAS